MTAYRTIDLEGTEVYRQGGDPSAPTLLLLHGFPSSSAQYDQLVQRLAGSAHMIAQVGLGPGMQAVEPYWQDRAANEADVRGFLLLEATRSQYVDGAADPTSVNPDLWELDQRYVDMPGRDQHFATATHSAEVAKLITAFLGSRVVASAAM